MSITRLWQAGFEVQSLYEIMSAENGNNDVSADAAYTGSYGWRCTKGTSVDYGVFTLPGSGLTQLQLGFWVKGNQDYGAVSGYSVYFKPYVSGVPYTSVDFDLFYEVGRITSVNGTSRDTCTGLFNQAWQHVGIDVKFDTTNGWCYVWRNGVLVMSWDGTTGTTLLSGFCLGYCSDVGSVGRYLDFDDIYVNNTAGEGSPQAPPLLRFQPLTVNGVGSYSQWTPTSGSNYENVDEAPADDDTTYVETTSAGNKDSYNMTTFTLDSNQEINAVIPVTRAKKSGAGEKIKLGVVSSGSDGLGSEKDIDTSYEYYFDRFTTQPDASPWDQDSMDDLEFLIESSGSF